MERHHGTIPVESRPGRTLSTGVLSTAAASRSRARPLARRIALIANLRGKVAARGSVLGPARRASVDRIVRLGHLATTGPRPGEVITGVRELGAPAEPVHHDAFLVGAELVHGDPESRRS